MNWKIETNKINRLIILVWIFTIKLKIKHKKEVANTIDKFNQGNKFKIETWYIAKANRSANSNPCMTITWLSDGFFIGKTIYALFQLRTKLFEIWIYYSKPSIIDLSFKLIPW